MKTSELNDKFIKMLKSLFKDKEIEITISSAGAKKGKEDFLKAVEDVRLRKNLVSFSTDEFIDFSGKMFSK